MKSEDSSSLPNQYVIDPKTHPRDWSYMVSMTFLAVGLALIAVGSYFLPQQPFWPGVVLGCVFAYVIFAVFCGRNDVQTLLISEDGLIIRNFEKDRTTVKISKVTPLELALEYVGSGDDQESLPTLNLWDTSSGFRRRNMLAQWVSIEGKRQLLADLSAFLTGHGFEVVTRDELALRAASPP